VCLGELAQVVEVGPAASAVVQSEQRTATVSLLTLDAEDRAVAPGDWVLCHSGFALARVSADAAADAAGIRATDAGVLQTLPLRKDDP